MKTLIFVGSPRKKGKSNEILDYVLKNIYGEVEVIHAYEQYLDIKPCVDCRYCWKKPSCAIKTDSMHEIYDKIEAANNIILISPIYFANIPGPLKMIIDRLQVYWSCSVRGDGRKQNTKNGFSVLVGGAPDYENQFLGVDLLVANMFKDLFINNLGSATFSNSDREDIYENEPFIKKIESLIDTMNNSPVMLEDRRIVNY